MKRMIFTVSGFGLFPTDMLRYDRCHPADQSQTNLVDNQYFLNDPKASTQCRHVTLARHVPNKKIRPTVERWKSVGWVVDENSIDYQDI